jgi:hypothetical protein
MGKPVFIKNHEELIDAILKGKPGDVIRVEYDDTFRAPKDPRIIERQFDNTVCSPKSPGIIDGQYDDLGGSLLGCNI